MTRLVLLVVALAACASLAAAAACTKDGVTGTCVRLASECVSTAAAPTRMAMSLCVSPTPICCLPGAAPTPAPATPVAPAPPRPTPVTPSTPSDPLAGSPACIKYDGAAAGRFFRGRCGPSDGSCPAGLVGGSDTNCKAYSPGKKCCYAPAAAVNYVVPNRVVKTNAMQPADRWTLEFVDDGRGALWADKTEWKNGASVVVGKLPYAEGFLKVIDGTGRVIDSFAAVSGPMGKGLLPNQAGTGYTVSLKEGPVATTGFPDETGFGFKYFIEPNKPKGFGRFALLIHTSSNPTSFGQLRLKAATEGCIGLNAGTERNVAFYNLLQGYLNRNKSIQLSVKVANNPNVGGN